jgi:hypothetical protein
MIKRVWRWLFHRHKPQSCVSRGMAAYLSTTARREAAFAQDFADDPMMCEPDIKPKKTQHITRIIETKTKPLPALDCDAPTLEVDGWQFYVEDTIADVDRYATAPMEMVTR